MVETRTAHEVVSGILKPQEAWEALITSGHIPQRFSEDNGRQFRSGFTNTWRSFPGSVFQCVLVADHWKTIEQAEELVAEAMTRAQKLFSISSSMDRNPLFSGVKKQARGNRFSLFGQRRWSFAGNGTANGYGVLARNLRPFTDIFEQLIPAQFRKNMVAPFWGRRESPFLFVEAQESWERIRKENAGSFRETSIPLPIPDVFEPLASMCKQTHHMLTRIVASRGSAYLTFGYL